MKLANKLLNFFENKVDWLMLVSSEENDRPKELQLNITDISKDRGGRLVISFKPNKTRDDWEDAMDEKSNWTCSGRIHTQSKGSVVFIGRFMANMDKIVVTDKTSLKDLGL